MNIGNIQKNIVKVLKSLYLDQIILFDFYVLTNYEFIIMYMIKKRG